MATPCSLAYAPDPRRFFTQFFFPAAKSLVRIVSARLRRVFRTGCFVANAIFDLFGPLAMSALYLPLPSGYLIGYLVCCINGEHAMICDGMSVCACDSLAGPK
jgi:hypothetical protein